MLGISLLSGANDSVPTEAAKKPKLNYKKVTLPVGKTVTLKVKRAKGKVKWKTNKKKIATVTKKGKVKAKKVGTAKITAKVAKKKYTCKVTVIGLNASEQSLVKGATTQLKVKGTKKKATWSSDDKKVATVTNGGLVTAMGAGCAKVTAKVDKKKITCRVYVENPVPAFDAYTGGTPATPFTSAETGTYKNSFRLTMAAQPGMTIYYTTDGSMPTVNAKKYTGKIDIEDRNNKANVLASEANIKKMYIEGSGYDYVPANREVAKCTVLRLVAVSPNGDMSPVVNRTFFVGNDISQKYKGASVISIVTPPENLLNEQSGIYVLGNEFKKWKTTGEASTLISKREYWNYQGNYTQHGKEWERTADMLYMDSATETVKFEAPIGIRIHGGASRMYGQKSFNVYFREEYGMKNLEYPLLPNDTDVSGNAIQKYKSVMLRNGGNDTEYTKIRDLFIQNQVVNRNYQIQATAPSVLFLNGEYWGLYNLTEKYGDNNLERTFGVDKKNIMIFKEGELDEGEETDKAYYEALWSYADKDFTDENVYNEFCNVMDIDSFADFYATHIYIANYDWNPEKNYQLWRARTPDSTNKYADGKWRYLLFDTEYSMGLYGHTDITTDSLAVALKEDKLFAAVMKNPKFQDKFLATIKEIGSVNFEPNACKKKLDEYTNLYKPLMMDFYTRFYGENSWLHGSFDTNVKNIKSFVTNRYNKIIPIVEKWCKDN